MLLNSTQTMHKPINRNYKLFEKGKLKRIILVAAGPRILNRYTSSVPDNGYRFIEDLK